MSKEVFIFEVNQTSFEKYVGLNSHKIPVVVEFMGIWSEPCIIVDGIFSKLAKEFAEEFIFAKVDIDEQAELCKQFDIQNVPTIIVFKDGKPVRTDVGQMQEEDARKLLKDFGVSRESDELRELAREKHLSGDTPAAILLLTEAIRKDPANTRVAMDMVQVFIDIGELEQAEGLYNRFPKTIQQTDTGKSLAGHLTFAKAASKTAGRQALLETLSTDSNNHDARFDLAVCMISDYDYVQASEELFKILEAFPEYRDGAARELIITISNILGPQEKASQKIRRKLANSLSK